MTRTALDLMVMPRSRSISMVSSSCDFMSRSSTVRVSSRMRSEIVDLPWSMCATIEKLRMWEVSKVFMLTILPEIGSQSGACLPLGQVCEDEEPTGLFFACGIYGKHAPDPAPRLDGRAFTTRFRLETASEHKLNAAQRERIRFSGRFRTSRRPQWGLRREPGLTER